MPSVITELPASTGDILGDDADALVNPVNTVGIMGRGLAASFRRRFPEMFENYRRACLLGTVRVGSMHVWANPAHLHGTRTLEPRLVINFPTKAHWRDPSRLEWIEAGLLDLVGVIERHRVTSVAIPPLGCGLGGLDFTQVRPLIEHHLSDVTSDVDVRLYIP